ncbi:tRNA (adenosine(37)-N6)-threonylcarbamoyltransferase complex transferase subunit TsaD [Candidatus Anaplasma sp. TIGMIC]|uniref:tRNA (adenosine(37)-N6)-threonylcarbamoyltransferase complex transferase subunit TsaD n=1 Tax=Candidatus Anaplasma sp. TIGMIC TaxID=3020713 RepID=UPI00232D7B54|nr:tRNA (adenosine(37)-N6)-threonylcarbamoyltransferase complex transferase subunit TsaD [Candidatus Anaplasma sp. TIGMIC]MDB1135706.1 tRNA (adenosine(37)-N6)-threonylcarbamoyltransferase complex transferase subunit TsaD [Candidatus Anaplasma sp. TIGMIC]
MSDIVLGIETSCDETAVAVLTSDSQVLAHEVFSQSDHSAFGGVVPEIAARAHFEVLPAIVQNSMKTADLSFSDLSCIAVTAGPGLVGSLIVGVMFAKAVAFTMEKPIIPVNHLEAHALVARMLYDVKFPFLVLIISGGHCQFMLAHGVGNYTKLGCTIDDSLGEAFDKVSRMLGLSYPGGPSVEEKALKGEGSKYFFPRALNKRPGCDFSFSGLKTAVRTAIEKAGALDEQVVCDICASFQECVGEILSSKIKRAAIAARELCNGDVNTLVVTGGVASNNFLRSIIALCVEEVGFSVVFPPRELCTDNGIMVAWAGLENLRLGKNISYSLEFAPRARWPLECLHPKHV